MDIPTTVEFSDVNSKPKANVHLPGPLRVGDPVKLKLKLQRKNGGRFEVLAVDHRFRVAAVGIDGSQVPSRQLLSLEAVNDVPTWRSIKKAYFRPRKLGPTHFPKTPI